MNTKIYSHELNRIRSMTDDQLWTRYNKMTKPKKIHTFHQVLINENRCRDLQQRILSDTTMRRTGSNGNTYREHPIRHCSADDTYIWRPEEAPIAMTSPNIKHYALSVFNTDGERVSTAFFRVHEGEFSQYEVMVDCGEKEPPIWDKDSAQVIWNDLIEGGWRPDDDARGS